MKEYGLNEVVLDPEFMERSVMNDRNTACHLKTILELVAFLNYLLISLMNKTKYESNLKQNCILNYRNYEKK